MVKVHIQWNYGGEEVYLKGSFTNWDYMIKLNKTLSKTEDPALFEMSLYMAEGIYYYHFVVDGKQRFAPDQPSTIY